jgi:protein transport protein SEC61 subunit alpha
VVQAFTRENGFNLSQLSGAFFIFLILVYMQRISAKVELISQKYPGYVQTINIKLFITSTMSVILQSMLISNFYKISQILHERFVKSALIKLIGTWQGDKITGGLLWYISAPYNLT